MLTVKETHMIHMRTTILHDKEPENIELMTRGSFVFKNGHYFISYVDSEATGMPGSTTTVKVAADASRVAVLRFGKTTSQLLMQRGQRNLCHYETGVGSMTLGVTADEIQVSLGDDGGIVFFRYFLDAGTSELMSENAMELTVTPLSQQL